MSATDLTPHQILAAARMLVAKRAPYFRAGLAQMVPRESPGYGTFATTKRWIMLWDPKVAVKYGVEGTAAVIVHELWHLLRDHYGRFNAPLINKDLANIAGDMSINPGVIGMGFALPDDGIMPAQAGFPDNLSAEAYYDLLNKMKLEYRYTDEQGQGSKVAFESDDGSDGDGDDGQEEQTKPGKGKQPIKLNGCGSCSGRERHDEPGDDDAEGRTDGEIQRTRVVIAKAIQAHGRGSVPGDLSRWADDELKPPKVPWREKLARMCRGAIAYRPGGGHSTYSRLSRRQGGIGFGPGKPILPSYRATRPNVAFLVDTSGSISQADLQNMMSEAKGILDACGAKMEIIVCDAEVHAAKEIHNIQEACKLLHGGGGSDFRPAFELIEQKKPRVDVIIAATDGDITVPKRAPDGPVVIWLLTTSYAGGYRLPCDWGTAIEVES